MRRTERAFFLEAIKPYLREGERVFESGTAVIYEIKFGSSFPPAENRWYLDCPSYFGSTETRQIGRVEQAPGWKEGLVCWTEKSKRFTGKGWEDRMLAKFLELTNLDRREPIAWVEKPVEHTCMLCGARSTVMVESPARSAR